MGPGFCSDPLTPMTMPRPWMKARTTVKVTGVLGNLLAPLWTLLVQPLQVGNDHGEELHDDGGVNVRRNAHGKIAKFFRAPPEITSKNPKISPLLTSSANRSGLTPGMGMWAPSRKIKIMPKVNRSFVLSSETLTAFFKLSSN